MTEFIKRENIFLNITKIGEVLLNSESYSDFNEKLKNNNIDCDINKNYEVAPGGFIDFNHDLYDDINHMNSISVGLYMEKSFVTFNIYIWTSLGEGFAIFKHVLRGAEINKLNSIEDIKEYFYDNLKELEKGILNTYSKDTKEALKCFGEAIENKKLPLANLFAFMSIENNIKDLM